MNIELVKRKYEDLLMRVPDVVCVGTALKANKEIIKIFVKKKTPESFLQLAEIIPKYIEGYETDIEEIGDVMFQAS